MFKYTVLLAGAAAALAFALPGKPLSTSGSWRLDNHHSDAQLTADGTTDYGKTKLEFTVGFARMNGAVKLDSADPANSKFDLHVYPSNAMTSPIDEEGNIKIDWFANHPAITLICFHSKGIQQMGDGRLQTTGTLVLTRMDRNVELTPSEAYAGPVYGPPIVHRLTREATFVFDAPVPGGAGPNGPAIVLTGSTNVVREDFPQLVRAVIGTYWPPVVQDKSCEMPAQVNEAYSGSHCTGTFLMSPPLPEAPSATNEEDYPGSPGFNTIVGQRLTIHLNMRLTPRG